MYGYLKYTNYVKYIYNQACFCIWGLFKTLLGAKDTEETVCLICFEAMVIGNKFSCDVSQDHQIVLFFTRINRQPSEALNLLLAKKSPLQTQLFVKTKPSSFSSRISEISKNSRNKNVQQVVSFVSYYKFIFRYVNIKMYNITYRA